MSDSTMIVSNETDLRRILRSVVREELESTRQQPSQQEWIGTDEMARMIGCHRGYVSQLWRERGLPARKVGKKLRARRSDVVEWIEGYSQGAA